MHGMMGPKLEYGADIAGGANGVFGIQPWCDQELSMSTAWQVNRQSAAEVLGGEKGFRGRDGCQGGSKD